jgi:putative transposase
LAFVNDKFKADILGYVIMPNHIHFIVYFRENNELSAHMRDMKKFTSTQIRIKLEVLGHTDIIEQIRNFKKGSSFQTWMDRYDDVYLQSKHLVETKLDYIHCKPLEAHWNLAKRPEDYKYSSAVYYEKGIQPILKIVDYREYFG